MKNIKLRIVYLILCSALLLFALFMLAVNLIIPAHFVREAKKALISEAQYQNRTIPYTDEEPIYDEGEEEGNFFTPSIVFLELDDGYLDNFRGDAETVAGLMLEIRRDFLRQGEVLYCRKLTLTAEAVDGHRIDKVRVALGE